MLRAPLAPRDSGRLTEIRWTWKLPESGVCGRRADPWAIRVPPTNQLVVPYIP